MSDPYDDVGLFHNRFDLPFYGDGNVRPHLMEQDVFEFRIKFLLEELKEFYEAHQQNDLEGAADALCDLVYVALGTAHFMHIPFNQCWEEVQRANMTKIRATSADDPASKRQHKFDVVKPPNFVPPDLAPLLRVKS